MQKVNLCDVARRRRSHRSQGFALADLLLGLGAAQEIERGGTVQKCPVCGFSQADFKKTGRLGCAVCYTPLPKASPRCSRAMHKGTHHTGKVPARLVRQLERDPTEDPAARLPKSRVGRKLRIRGPNPGPNAAPGGRQMPEEFSIFDFRFSIGRHGRAPKILPKNAEDKLIGVRRGLPIENPSRSQGKLTGVRRGLPIENRKSKIENSWLRK